MSVSLIAGALIRPRTSAVQARMLAHARVHTVSFIYASTRIGIDAESRIADAHVRGDASCVRSATVSALRAGRVGGWQGNASTGIGIGYESWLAGASVISNAGAVRTAIVSTVAGMRWDSGCRYGDASTGIGIDTISVSALR